MQWLYGGSIPPASSKLKIMTTKTISMKSVYGNYTTFTKQFNDEKHFDNWYRYISNRGHKIIGVYDN